MQTLQPGQIVLDNFELVREMGSGAFARAFLARQRGTDRMAVVKIAHPHLAQGAHRDAIVQRFNAECKAATRIQHPNLATVYLCGEVLGGLPAIAMEHVPGHTLREVLKRKAPLRPRVVAGLGNQLGSALQAIHSARIIHRDLSPNNVLVTPHPHRSGRVLFKLLDFGVAKLDDLSSFPSTPLGTPRYIAPEQLVGQATYASDVFSLGAILWWAITGRELVWPDDGSTPDLNRVYDQMSLLRPDLPAACARFFCQMLHHNATLRPEATDIVRILPKLVEQWEGEERAVEAQARHDSMPSWSFTSSEESLPAVAQPYAYSDPPAQHTSQSNPHVSRSNAHAPQHNPYAAPPDPYTPRSNPPVPQSQPRAPQSIPPASRSPHPSHRSQEFEASRAPSHHDLRAVSRNALRAAQATPSPIQQALSVLNNAQRGLLIDRVMGDFPMLIADLDGAFDEGDRAGLQRSSDAIEGLALAIGAEGLALLVQRLRTQVAAERWADARPLVDALQDEYAAVFREILALNHAT